MLTIFFKAMIPDSDHFHFRHQFICFVSCCLLQFYSKSEWYFLPKQICDFRGWWLPIQARSDSCAFLATLQPSWRVRSRGTSCTSSSIWTSFRASRVYTRLTKLWSSLNSPLSLDSSSITTNYCQKVQLIDSFPMKSNFESVESEWWWSSLIQSRSNQSVWLQHLPL